jgi:hypothetical protein
MFKLVAVLLIEAVLTGGSGQQGVSSPRVAALRFAVESGLEIPAGPRALASDTRHGMMHTDGIIREPGVTESREAQLMSRQLQSEARIAPLAQLLHCVRDFCVPLVRESVVQVNDATRSGDGADVAVTVYVPSDKPLEYDGLLVLAVVHVVQRDGAWAGVSYSWGPRTAHVRQPKKMR